MDIEDKRRVGEQIEPGDRPKAPGRLELLQRFINTWNHELPTTWDRIGTPRRAQAWLRQRGLITRQDTITPAGVEHLRMFRESLRTIIGANDTEPHDPAVIDAVQAASRSATLAIAIDERGRTSLHANGTSADRAIGVLLGIMHDAQLSGDWRRLTACRQCRYVFYDRSRNRSAVWCSMSICGNRTKNRAYYRRRHPSG
jgi:predicted RNA-binding Zn ribbon-like protein